MAIFSVFSVLFCSGLIYFEDTLAETSQENTEKNGEEESRETRNFKTPYDFGYELRDDQKRERQRTQFQGKRGGEKPLTLEIIAPEDHIATTFNPYPEFWIQISSIPELPLQYNLIQDRKSIWEGNVEVESTLFLLKVEDAVPSLSPGIYVLAIGYNCPEDCYVARIAFEVVQKDELIQNIVEQNKNIKEKIKFLSKEGYWYDAQSLIFQMD
ncbi:DUF928 domain-containing protein [Crocosphaera sp. Alani8]|uniref:DUF928 domain-containing protein n=1 Tax=Crocosphaera sp. Alani8 TaxID=3038952 RepID=UPI00313E05C7